MVVVEEEEEEEEVHCRSDRNRLVRTVEAPAGNFRRYLVVLG